MKTNRVERVAAEAAADEERAGLAQVAADDRNVEVDAGGDVRDRKALLVDGVREQHVVDMAAVAGNIDDFVARRDLAQRLRVAELDAVVDPRPQAREDTLAQEHEGVRVIGSDLLEQRARVSQDPGGAGSSCPAAPAPRGAHCAGAQHLGHDRAPVRQIRTDMGGARLGKLCLQLAGDAPCGLAAWRIATEQPRNDTPGPNCMSVLRPLNSTVSKRRNRLASAQSSEQRQAQPGTLLLRRATPVTGTGTSVTSNVGSSRTSLQHCSSCAGGRRSKPRAPGADAARQRDDGAVVADADGQQALGRARQVCPGAGALQYHASADALALQHVADWRRGLRRVARQRLCGAAQSAARASAAGR